MGKTQTANTQAMKKDRFVWTPQMDDALVEALYTQQVEGNRVDGTFTTKAYDMIIEELRTKIGPGIDKEKVKNRMKTLKGNFNECYDAFKGAWSGFAWNATTGLWSAEEEVWEALLKTKPEVVKWKTIPIRNYDKLCELFGRDRATGEGAETAKEKRERWATESSEIAKEKRQRWDADSENNIEIDEFMARNGIVFETDDLNDDVEVVSSKSSGKVIHGLSRKGKKRRIPTSANNDKELEIITGAIQSIASAINAPVRIQNESQSENYLKESLWKDLEAIGLEQPLITDAYMLLAQNSEKRITFMGCPVQVRLDVLMRMLGK